MIYITTKRAPVYRQMTLDELLDAAVSADDFGTSSNTSSTYTYKVEHPSNKILKENKINDMIMSLVNFNQVTSRIRETEDKHTLYTTFYMPKKDKGMPYFVRSFFDAQGKFIPCDYKEVFRNLASAIHPLLEQHETTEQNGIYDECERKVRQILENGGFFDMNKVDFGAALKGAFRRIDAPKAPLQAATEYLKNIFQMDFHVLYHTSAYAYINDRGTIDAVRRHQENDSRWFGKLDLSNFFNSTTPEFLMKMFSMVFPFSEIIRNPTGKEELQKALSIAFLDGGLPQGTKISPLLTNIMMIPIDHTLSNKLHWYKNQRYVYTRYADDFIISSQYTFNIREIEKVVKDALAEFGAPFTVNETKTRYGSRSGSNWNLGVMLNKDNKITVGYQNIRRFKTQLFQYVMDKQSGNPWGLTEVRKLDGIRSYYTMVEGETIDKIIAHMNKKLGVDIREMIRRDMKGHR